MQGHRCGVIDQKWSVSSLCSRDLRICGFLSVWCHLCGYAGVGGARVCVCVCVCVWGRGCYFWWGCMVWACGFAGGNTSPWMFFACSGPFRTVGWLVGCVQSRGLGVNAPHFPRFILLISFSDNLLVVKLYKWYQIAQI